MNNEYVNLSPKNLADMIEFLYPKWKYLYFSNMLSDIASSDDKYPPSDLDFESFCIGWCVAHGLTTMDGYKFYKEMVKRRLF